MIELSETAKRRLKQADRLRICFRSRVAFDPLAGSHEAFCAFTRGQDDECEEIVSRIRGALDLPYSTDPTDSLGLSKVWGFTVETLIGAAFFYIWLWHDARQERFDMPVAEADALALKWARFTAEYWPDKKERKTLQRVVKWLGWLIPLYGKVRWKWIGGKR